MSSNIDRSLDEIVASRQRGGRRGRGGPAPAGGIRKRPQRAAAQKANASITPAAQVAAAKPKLTATKIIVSNLPYDVTEAMIKEYFQQVVGPITRATLTYGPDGRSRGVATVEFRKPEHAATAAQKYNGVEVDKRPMKVELVVDPNAPASFAERVGQPNKIPAAAPTKADKPKPVVKSTRGRGRGRGGRASGSGRGKPKTAEQLDQEMSDYFESSNNANGSAAPAAATASADAEMEDTVL
ncbi:RNA-binding domain-containing protein [Ascodesmis nigricans]|uniref:RNA-binding domain-containing protein n=1 Tax=Ascodesmis nigricans TaxID=341454 RepID=A0A4S2MII4_9PEZI|nr:RNA-binding domain-containing protein [Ascodesmis nigricans]